MQAIKEFYHSRDVAGIPKHNTHDIASFEVTRLNVFLPLMKKQVFV